MARKYHVGVHCKKPESISQQSVNWFLCAANHDSPLEETATLDAAVAVAHLARQLQPDERVGVGVLGAGQRSHVAHAADDDAPGARDHFDQVAELQAFRRFGQKGQRLLGWCVVCGGGSCSGLCLIIFKKPDKCSKPMRLIMT